MSRTNPSANDRTPDRATHYATQRATARRAALAVAAFLACSSVLRAPISAVPPLTHQIADALSATSTQIGLLTSIPVLCFGLLTPISSQILRKWGVFASMLGGLALIVVGSLVRSGGGLTTAYSGTVLIGLGIAVGNVAVPMMISRQFPTRVASMTGIYSSTVNVAVTAATASVVPLAALVGWRAATASWGVVLGLIAAAIWVTSWLVHRRADESPAVSSASAASPSASPESQPISTPGGASIEAEPGWLADARRGVPRAVVVLLTIAFCGHTIAYYALSSWLPTALGDTLHVSEAQAGVAASIFQLLGIVGPLTVPFLLNVLHWSRTTVVAVISAAWLVLPVGFVVAPQGWLFFSVLSGMAQGAFFTAVFVIVIEKANSVDETRRVSATVQTAGYLAAATGPVIVAQIHEAIGGWTAPFVFLSVVVAVMALTAVTAVRVSALTPRSTR